jgi:hypothetical protein
MWMAIDRDTEVWQTGHALRDLVSGDKPSWDSFPRRTHHIISSAAQELRDEGQACKSDISTIMRVVIAVY